MSVLELRTGLSSGQRRRVALARALLPGRIVVIAAHHPRVVAIADQVVRLTLDETPVPVPAARYEEIPA